MGWLKSKFNVSSSETNFYNMLCEVLEWEIKCLEYQ